MNKAILIILATILFIYGCTSTNLAGSAVKENIEITSTKITCSDTDGGDLVDVRGSVILEVNNNYWKNYTDKCINSDSVMEYYCEKDEYKQKKYICDNACINGMCR